MIFLIIMMMIFEGVKFIGWNFGNLGISFGREVDPLGIR